MLNEISDYSDKYLEQINVKKKTPIYREGTQSDGLFYVNEGLIGLYQVTETGKESLLRIYGAGSFFGYRSLFTKQRYHATSRAMLNSQVTKVKLNRFCELQAIAPKLSNSLMLEVCAELGEAEQRVIKLTSTNAKQRIRNAIHALFTLYPTYPWTYREIGEYSDTDTSTVIRYCNFLKQQGLLDATSRRLVPINLAQFIDYKQ